MGHQLLLTIEAVSELTGFPIGTLYHWVSQRRIPVVRFSPRCIRFRRSDIEAWIDKKVESPVTTSSVEARSHGARADRRLEQARHLEREAVVHDG